VVEDEYLFKSGTKVRTHMSCKAAILVLFACTSSRQGEEVTTARDLRCQLTDILVNCASTTSELPEPAHQQATEVSFPDPDPDPDPLPTCTGNSSTTVTSTTPPSNQTLLKSALTAKPKTISTETLLQIQESIQRQQQPKGRRYKSRAVDRRLSQQKEELAQLAKTIHHGSKQDFLSSLAHSVNSPPKTLEQDEDWDGSLLPQDILALAKQAHDPQKRMSVYDTIIAESAPHHYHLYASDVLDIQDTTSATEIVRALRRKLPGFLDSERKVNIVKAKYNKEFEVVWKPKRTHSGWQINPERLRETLLYLYWWLPENEWWKIYGDGRNFGGKDSVALTLNTLNDEAMFNGVAYHSPEEYWPIAIFYGKDKQKQMNGHGKL